MFKGITFVSWSRREGQAGLLKLGALWSGIVWALASAAFICVGLLLWVFMTAREVYHFNAFVMAAIWLGALVGGAVGGRTSGNLGWLHGMVVGFIYYLAVMLLSALWSPGLSVLSLWLAQGLVVVTLSTAGGVVGVNIPAAWRNSHISRSRDRLHRKRFPV
ncbi:TIGR04086 family membrane protein [Desulfoscipio sp. XC116]|uniref:TIGR04086 family membrane protein n=1 Tax=Desulfoscipio sp. XC116 TaxID=3144975 RepID=UPI00325BDFEF